MNADKVTVSKLNVELKEMRYYHKERFNWFIEKRTNRGKFEGNIVQGADKVLSVSKNYNYYWNQIKELFWKFVGNNMWKNLFLYDKNCGSIQYFFVILK